MSDAKRRAIGIEDCACVTALGDTRSTLRRLLAGEIGLELIPVLGKDGGDAVPLATIGDHYDETVPPRWEIPLDALLAKAPAADWGSPRFPVFLSSSNFDVGSLYSYRRSGSEAFLGMGTPARTLESLRQRYGWGANVLALSHACVTAHVAIDMAQRYLEAGLAEKTLIVSFDFVSPFVAGGFHSLKILNDQLPAPFQDREVGSIGLGDGAAYLALSREEAPCRIEANFLYNEMYHFTSNEPTGSGFKTAADWTLAQVGETPVWIKGHGTGTLDSGRLEAEAFQQALPESPLVSWKGSLGHTLGSCGAVELAIAVEAMKQGSTPGTVGASQPTFAPNVAVEAFDNRNYKAAALFSNAFGGAHGGCLIRYD